MENRDLTREETESLCRGAEKVYAMAVACFVVVGGSAIALLPYSLNRGEPR